MAIPLTTMLLIRDLQHAASEEDKKAIRVALVDILHDSRLTEEREAIQDALLTDSSE